MRNARDVLTSFTALRNTQCQRTDTVEGPVRSDSHRSNQPWTGTAASETRNAAAIAPQLCSSARNMQNCAASFREVAFTCTNAQYHRLCVILSCTLTAFRPLRVVELAAMLIVFGDPRDRHHRQAALVRETVSILRTAPNVLCVSDQGVVKFADESMRSFLQQSRLPGIDQSHMMLASLCLRQIENELFEKDTVATRWRQNHVSFSSYSHQWWRPHCASISSNPYVTTRAHRLAKMLQVAEAERVHYISGCEPVDHVQSELENMGLSSPDASWSSDDDLEDWCMV